MKTSGKKTQQGAITIIVVFIVVVIITGMVISMLSSSSATLNDGSQQVFQSQSNYLAESAIERAAYHINNATACGSIPTSTYNLGSGTFNIVTSSGTTECLVTVKGMNNGFVNTFSTIVTLASSGPSGSYKEEFPSVADFTAWTQGATSKTQGAWGRDATANYAASGSLGTSLVIYAESTGNQKATFSGDIWRTITDPVDTTSGEATLNFSLALMSDDGSASGVPSNPEQLINISLIDSTGTYADLELWTSKNQNYMDNTATWSEPPGTITTVPVNRVYDAIEVYYKISSPKRSIVLVYLDDLSLNW